MVRDWFVTGHEKIAWIRDFVTFVFVTLLILVTNRREPALLLARICDLGSDESPICDCLVTKNLRIRDWSVTSLITKVTNPKGQL
jgi:hypothetical protein